jgi:hypothetical protein
MHTFKNIETQPRRSFTPQLTRNPILLNEHADQEQLRLQKARVPQYLVHTKWAAERPRGLATGEFSRLNQSSISFSTQPLSEHKPIRKMIKVEQRTETLEKPTKRMRPSSSERNPILQTCSTFEPGPPRCKPGVFSSPSVLTILSNQKKHLMTSDWSTSFKDR